MIYIKLLLTAMFWGGTFIAGRVVAQDVGPFSAAFFRFTAASFFLIIVVWKVEGKLTLPDKKGIIYVILLGLTGVFLYNIFFFKGLKLIKAGRAAIIIALNPIFITLLSSYFFKEKLNVVKISGIIISVAGAIVVITKGNLHQVISSGIGTGEIYILFCVFSWVAYSLIGKVAMNNLSPLISVSYSAIIGAILLFVPAVFEGMIHNFTGYNNKDWLSIFYLGFFGTVIGFVWYYEGIKKIGPMKASIFINFVPVCAVIFAFFILDEQITKSLLIGTLMVCSGVFLTNTTLTVSEKVQKASCSP